VALDVGCVAGIAAAPGAAVEDALVVGSGPAARAARPQAKKTVTTMMATLIAGVAPRSKSIVRAGIFLGLL